MKEIAIFTGSYPQIKNTLYVVTQNYPKHPITIVVGTGDYFKLLNLLNERLFNNTINLIKFELFQPKRAHAKGLKKIFYILPDIIRERRYWKEIYHKYLSKIEGYEVFFFDRSASQFSLVKNLAGKNRLVYIEGWPTGTAPVPFSPANIVEFVKLIIAKLIYSRDIYLAKYPHEDSSPFVSDRFMKEHVDIVFEGEERDKLLKDFELGQYNLYDTGKFSVIYFDSSFLGSKYIKDDDTYRKEFTEIFDVLIKHIPESEIALKYHPDYPPTERVINIGTLLPEFIPSELLYNDNVKMYLSISSSSIANVEKGLVVSLLDLITFKNDTIKNSFKEILIKMSHTEILFPRSLEEFEQILISLKQQHAVPQARKGMLKNKIHRKFA